jgi:phosphoserine aminotransferase
MKGAAVGSSHRTNLSKAELKQAIDLTGEVLEVPADHRIGIVPASETGAVGMAVWTMLGARGVVVVAWESFGEGWVTGAVKQLKLADCRVIKPGQGKLPDLASIDSRMRDVVFTWNGTTSGVRVPSADWIAADREGVILCNATSAAFAQNPDLAKLDGATFSWRNVLGGGAAHGMLILSPRAVARPESSTPSWPPPGFFRMTSTIGPQEEHLQVHLFCAIRPLRARPAGQAPGGLSGGPGQSRRARRLA